MQGFCYGTGIACECCRVADEFDVFDPCNFCCAGFSFAAQIVGELSSDSRVTWYIKEKIAGSPPSEGPTRRGVSLALYRGCNSRD